MKQAKDNLENATARPWKVAHFEMSLESEVSNGVKIVSCENGDTIADNETYYPHAITEANAALIVRCVNSHDALVEALEGMINAHSLKLWQTTNGTDDDVIKNLNKILNLAKGEV